MVKHKVDIVQTGHVHDYQRSWPTYKGKAMKKGTNKTHYIDPEYPVYAVQGTGGALANKKYVSPTPEWSAKNHNYYGYGRIKIQGGHLRYQAVSAFGGKVVD